MKLCDLILLKGILNGEMIAIKKKKEKMLSAVKICLLEWVISKTAQWNDNALLLNIS